MSTFSKLSLVAQYDDMCRIVNDLVKEALEEENNSIVMLEKLQASWHTRESKHAREKESLKNEISSLNKEIKKLNRQLAESRAALVREADDKKNVAREKKALLEQIRQVRQLVEKEGYGDADAHRKRVIKCLDLDRLSPIHSDEDSGDCASGLDYDRTEDDIIDNSEPIRPSRRSRHEEVIENLHTNDEPTLLCRYLKNADDNLRQDEHRRSSRHAHTRRSAQSLSTDPATATTTSSSNNHDKFPYLNTETDTNSMDTDDLSIERIRQHLKHDAEKNQKILSTISTPQMKDQKKGATLSSRSAANLMKSISNVSTPVPNAVKPHTFVSKKSFKPENCVPCGGKVGFYGDCVKCEVCGVVSHPDCKEKCPLPCVKITAPNTRSKQRKILISDYVNDDAVPKVPALIVHCCNEIERDDNIVAPGLYRVVAHTKEIEELQQKILKSKSGMPNLSKLDVHLLTGVVKRFLQSLDEALITTSFWSHFAEAVKLDSALEAKTHMSYYISYDLPPANRDTLCYLMQHYHAIAKYSDKNMMTVENLAKTLAPTIIGNSCRKPSQSVIMNETKIQIQIMKALFGIEEEFWAKFVPRVSVSQTSSLGSRLLSDTPTGRGVKTRSSKIGATLPTPRLKPLFLK